jgi:HD-GYP domain-containing protein (c-di-GMP phosphodiesterase class II)
MSDTRTLLARIGALRQRLEQAQQLADDARDAVTALAEGPRHILQFDTAVALGGKVDEELSQVVRPITVQAEPEGPKFLSSRARRVLEQGSGLLARLRELASLFDSTGDEGPSTSGASLLAPLRSLYQETVAMIDTAIRTIPLLPGTASDQMRLCKGLEAVLGEVDGRLRTLAAGGEKLRRQHEQVHSLAEVLVALETGQPFDAAILDRLVADVLAEVDDCSPLVFLYEAPEYMPAWVACHSLTVARVLARLVMHEPQLRAKASEAVLAALLHDVGMLAVPAEVLAFSGELEEPARRAVEAHASAGRQHLAGLFRNAPHILDAISCHHERLDGTGYPDGLREAHISPLARLLAVCDTYAAMCVPRPHRPARSTRAALADTVLLAEEGKLDRQHAALLLKLSFYPTGSVVELASGGVGVVVAAGEGGNPARPVVAVLTDDNGDALARPRYLDLSRTTAHSIVRPLTVAEKLDVLGQRLARWAA